MDIVFLGEGEAAPADADAVRFDVLPFSALPHVSAPRDPGPKGYEWKRYNRHRLRVLRGLDWLLSQQVDVINISLGWDRPFDPKDPLHLATLRSVELGTVVVVAAGNDGPSPGSLQELALAPWVIAVGATDDAYAVLETSSRGSEGGRNPTVACSGTDLVHPPLTPGTSFAAPKVSAAAGVLKIALEAVCERIAGAETYLLQPLRLGVADDQIDPSRLDRHLGAVAASLHAVGNGAAQLLTDPRQRVWIDRLAAWLGGVAAEVEFRVTPSVVLRAVQLAARPLAAPAAYVGSGYFSLDEALLYLGSLTPSRLLAAFAPDVVQRQEPELYVLDAELGPLLDHVDTYLLYDVVFTGLGIIAVDVVE